MRHLRNLLLLAAIATLHCMHADAQATCAEWAKVTAWKGSYTLKGSGSASLDSNQFTILQNSSAASVNMNNFGGICPGKLGWTGVDSQVSATTNDEELSPCPNPPGGTMRTDWNGTTATGSGSGLVIDTSAGTFAYGPSPGANVTLSGVDCNGKAIGPFPISGFPIWPAPNWPLTFPLPNSVQALTNPTDPSFADGAGIDAGAPLDKPWTFTFTLNPIKNDDVDHPCLQDGGSSIACHNQSLREDVPIVGTGLFLHYESGRSPGRDGAFGPATADALMIGGWTLSVHHAVDPARTILFLGDGRQRSGWQLSAPVAFNSNVLLTSEDGSEVYVFDNTARHIQTLKPLTGAVKYQFSYDAAGNLITITDGSGNVTTIQRDASEHPVAIVSPFGQTTTLSVDSNGFLSQITDPAGNTEKFTNSSTGLLMSRTDANGNQYTYGYDSQGALTLDADPIGGSSTMSQIDTDNSDTVTLTTAMGLTSTYLSMASQNPGEQLVNTWPNGLQATVTNTQQNGQLSESTTLPDGTSNSQTLGPDPRFGLQWPVLTSETLTQGNLTMNITGSRTASFTQGNPFSLTTQTDTETVNGRKYTSVFTASTKTLVDTTPVKRPTTTILDSLERISSVQVGLLLPVQFAYDTNGRLATITHGTRVSKLTYDANGFLASSTDPLNQTTGFTHDAAGRLATETLPDGRAINYTYDANGNLAFVTPPGKSAHNFSYTAVDLMATYTPPNVPGTGLSTYSYNADRDVTKITRPDGQTVDFGYDSAGRLSSTTTPTETIIYSYDAASGNLSSSSVNGGEALTYGYNGPLPTSSALTGTVSGTVSRAYNNNFWVTSESINGGNTVNFNYDNDGLLTKAGALTLKLDPKDGLIKGSTLASLTDSLAYDTLGELTGYTAKHGTTVLYSEKYTRDADGRISGKTETIGGKKNAYTYNYDVSGRLTGVKKNGAVLSSYTYDSNSNRLTATTSSGTVTGTYDAQDRLLTYGNASYTYTANGELASQTVGSQTTAYSYDVLGNLTASTVPSGTVISYIVDAGNRRVGKQVNGTLVAGYLYDGDHIVAQLNGSNAIVSQFIYGSGTMSPDYMIQGAVTYRIFSDQLGSPRLVVNTSTGAIAEQIDYDEFGNLINDTNPGFQPFGFAGGLYDQDTKLVRFGSRDYSPSVGRWTAKDPILFDGGDTNLYGYVLNDPVNSIDSNGNAIFRVTTKDRERESRKRTKSCPLPPKQNPKPPKNTPPPGNPLEWINIGPGFFLY
jgi:RHS repeat-associated protein